jgi:hypothetical protein
MGDLAENKGGIYEGIYGGSMGDLQGDLMALEKVFLIRRSGDSLFAKLDIEKLLESGFYIDGGGGIENWTWMDRQLFLMSFYLIGKLLKI